MQFLGARTLAVVVLVNNSPYKRNSRLPVFSVALRMIGTKNLKV